MILRKLPSLIGAALLGFSVSTYGHPGHEPFSEGTRHFVSSPSHLLPAFAFAALVMAGAQFLRNSRERAFIRLVALTIAAVSLLA